MNDPKKLALSASDPLAPVVDPADPLLKEVLEKWGTFSPILARRQADGTLRIADGRVRFLVMAKIAKPHLVPTADPDVFEVEFR